MESMTYGVVFAGGGTKGAYQIGAMKALRELNLRIGAVVGSSIGSINAALFAQGDLKKITNIYRNIEMEDIMELSDTSKLKDKKNLLTPENVLFIAEEYFKNKGISNEPLRKLLEKNLNVNNLYKSKIDYGLMTFDVNKKTGVPYFKEDIKREEIIDYILASACFPIFKPQKIGGESFLDGGVSDVLPINMLVKKGYNNIILIDVKGIGIIQRNSKRKVNFKVIKPTLSLGGTFEFNHDTIDKNIMLGYLDTMKVFHKYNGLYYYFKKKEYYKLLNDFTVEEVIGLEEAANIYNMDKYKVYTKDEFLKEIYKLYKKEEKEYESIDNRRLNIKSINSSIKKGFGISLTIDLISNYPTILSSYNGVLSRYIKAGFAINELKNNYRKRNKYEEKE